MSSVLERVELTPEKINELTSVFENTDWDPILYTYFDEKENVYHSLKKPEDNELPLAFIEISTKENLSKNCIYKINGGWFLITKEFDRSIKGFDFKIFHFEPFTPFDISKLDGKPYGEREYNIMSIALKISSYSENEVLQGRKPFGGPFGAIVVKNVDGEDRVVGISCNQVIKNNDPTAHAEVMAIRDAGTKLGTWDLSGCELYTSCEPCPMCLMAAKWANIEKIYYAANRFDAEDIGFRDNNFYGFLKEDVDTGIQIDLAKDTAQLIMKNWLKTCDGCEY